MNSSASSRFVVTSLAWRLFSRDWRAGELRVLILAVLIAVASITAVGFFTDRIRLILEHQANELLGADVVLSSTHQVDHDVLSLGKSYQLQATTLVQFPSMVLSDHDSQLASIRAVEAGYPLRGTMQISQRLFAPEEKTEAIPEPGTVWMESRLFNKLGLRVGDRIDLGQITLTAAAVLVNDPARAGANVFSVAPRMIMNRADLGSSGLIQPGSRVEYQYLFAGDEADVVAFSGALKPKLKLGERFVAVEEARPEVRVALERARSFLGLSSLVTIILAGVAIALATRRFVNRHLDTCAMLRCFGCAQSAVINIFVMQLLLAALLASAVGILIGYFAQSVLGEIVVELAKVQLPPPSMTPVIQGLGLGMLMLLGFAVPTLLHLRHVPPLRVLRKDLGRLPQSSALAYAVAMIFIMLFIFWYSPNVKMALYIFIALVVAVFMLLAMTRWMLRMLLRYRQHFPVVMRFGLNNLSRRAQSSSVQIIGFGMGMMVLLLLTTVKSDLLSEWENRLPEQTPNRFIINIFPEQVEAMRQFFNDRGLDAPAIQPMIRARWTSLNGQPVDFEQFDEPRSKRLAQREFNLSWAADVPEDNKVIDGNWWSSAEHGQAIFSFEEELAETLGVKMGDRVGFSVDGVEVVAKVVNLREVNWDSFRVNFFVIGSPGTLSAFPSTHITSFYLDESDYVFLNELVKAFPNISVIDVAAVMKQVREIINKVSLAVEYVFYFTLLAGLVVLYAAIQSTLDERLRETAILKTLGAQRRQLALGTLSEFSGIGLLAGFIASLGAAFAAYLLANRVFHLAYIPDPGPLLLGVLLGGVFIGLAGLLATLNVLRQPALQSLSRV